MHYESKYHDVVKQRKDNTKYHVKILNDNQALLMKDDNVQLVGDQKEILL